VYVRDDLKGQGYSKEDEYFHRKDKELIEKLQQKAQALRTNLGSENGDKEYWMRCPKCGTSLKEENYGDLVLVDRCTSNKCGGIFLDGGELEILLKAKSSLLQRIFGR
jgi:Zn-finger nucleic acid-binding protein